MASARLLHTPRALQTSLRSQLSSAASACTQNHSRKEGISLGSAFTRGAYCSVFGKLRIASAPSDRSNVAIGLYVGDARNGAAEQRRGTVTSMAWGGTLAAVRLIIQGKHMEVTDSIRSYVEEKVGHAVQNHGALVREVDVRLSVRGGDLGKGPKLQRCEVTIFTKKHGVLRAEEEDETMYAAIDEVSDIVSRKLRKIKEKDGGHGRSWQMRGKPKLGELIGSEPDPITPILNREPEDDIPAEVVRTKYFEMKPMRAEEAVEQLVNLGHQFYAFRNETSGEINILYKRTHGGYGIIVPRNDESWESPNGKSN